MAKKSRDRENKKAEKAEKAPEKEFSEELLTEGGESQEDRLKKIEELFKTEDGVNLELSRLLWQVNANNDYESLGYDSFEDYVEQRLGFKRRKGKYLVAIWQKFRVELGLEPKKLGRVGWWKSSIIMPVITLDNHEEWIDKAKRMKSRELQKEVQRALGGNNQSDLKAFTVKLSDEQKANVEAAIRSAQREVNTDAKGNALDLICTEYQANRMKPEDKPGWIMQQFERNWDCRILAVDPEIFAKVKDFTQKCLEDLEDERKIHKREKIKEAAGAETKEATAEETPKKKKKKSKKLEKLKKLAKKPKPEQEEDSDEADAAEGPKEGAEKAESKKVKKLKKAEAESSEDPSEDADDVSEDGTEAEDSEGEPEEAGV